MRIRYYGRQGERTGYGRAAEHYIAALRGAGATVEAVSLATSSFDGDYVDAEAVDAVIVHALPQDCPRILERLTFVTKTGGDSRPEPPVVAYTTWEALTIDHDISLYLQQGFDEVWVPSNAAAQPFRDNPNPGEDHNVHVIPHCMHEDDLSVPFVPARNPRGLFRFTWIGAWNARKNPSGLIRAFVHAFRPHFNGYEGDVELYLHSHGTPIEALVAELAATGLAQHHLPRIVLNNEQIADDEVWTLIANSDCFVSAARGEAWNMPCFEALAQKRLIITTENLGSDDYLLDTDAQRVNARRTPAWNTLSRSISAAGQVGGSILGAQGLTSHDLWLEPDLERFAKTMRRVYESKVRQTTINYSLTERYGYAAVAKQILTRLENLIK